MLISFISIIANIILLLYIYYIHSKNPDMHSNNNRFSKFFKDNFIGHDIPIASTKLTHLLSQELLQKSLCSFSDRCNNGHQNFIIDPYNDTLFGELLIDLSTTRMGSSIPKFNIYNNYPNANSIKLISVDNIAQGYQKLFESASMFSYTNFLGIPLQQDPNDAFAIMDMIWRVKPDLIIELGFYYIIFHIYYLYNN